MSGSVAYISPSQIFERRLNYGIRKPAQSPNSGAPPSTPRLCGTTPPVQVVTRWGRWEPTGSLLCSSKQNQRLFRMGPGPILYSLVALERTRSPKSKRTVITPRDMPNFLFCQSRFLCGFRSIPHCCRGPQGHVSKAPDPRSIGLNSRYFFMMGCIEHRPQLCGPRATACAQPWPFPSSLMVGFHCRPLPDSPAPAARRS